MLTESNSTVAWAYTFAQVHNESHCGVCMELAMEVTAGLPSLPLTCLCGNTLEHGVTVMPKVNQNGTQPSS